MADRDFGVKGLNLLGQSGTPSIISPNNLNINASTVSVSTDFSVGGKIVSNLLVSNSYSVGIGTTILTEKLNVNGNVKVSGIVSASSFVGSGSNLTGLIPNSITGIDTNYYQYFLVSPQASGTISSLSATSNYIIFNPSAKYLGIGTNSPSANIDVVGTGKFSGSVSTPLISFNNNIRIGNTYTGANLTQSANSNSFIGPNAGMYNTYGCYNTFLGHESGFKNTYGNNNTFVGKWAGYYNTLGNYNSAFGVQAGNCNTTGSYNNFFGRYTGVHDNTSYRVVVGLGLSATTAFDVPKNADKQFAVGLNTSGTAEYWLVGNENFNIGIGATNPSSKLTVKAGVADTTNWVVTYGDTGIGVTEQSVSGVAYDSVGNIYATGADYDNGIPFVVKFNPYGSIIWQKFFEHPDPNRSYKLCEGVAVDKSTDNLYISVLPDDTVSSSIIVKLDGSSSNIIWQKEINDTGSDSIYAIGIGTTGDVYVAGETDSQGAGSNDAFLIKFNSSGTEQWQRVIGGVNYENGNGIAVDYNNNVYVTGQAYNDALLIKFNSSGTEQWQRVIGGVNYDYGTGIAVDSNNNVYVTGQAYNDTFLIKFNSSGTEQWQRVIGDVSYDYGTGIAVDSNNNVYVTGGTNVQGKFLIASFDSLGNLIIQKHFYSDQEEYQWYYWGHDLIDIKDDKLVIGGYTYNTSPEYYADGIILQISKSLNTEYFGNNNDFVLENSNLTVGISTLTVATSSLTVSTSTLPVASAGLTTSVSPPVYTSTLYPQIRQISIDADQISIFDFIRTNEIKIGQSYIKNFNDNFIVGVCAGRSTTTGSSNNFLGRYAGRFNTTGSYNNFLGNLAGYCNTTGSYNNFLGNNAGRCNTTGCYNNFLGYQAGFANTTGGNNNFFGISAGHCNTSGGNNNFFGSNAGYNNTTGSYNNFFGSLAGLFNTTGSSNNFLGNFAGYKNTCGSSNNFFGNLAGRNNTSGCNNNFLGNFVGYANTTGYNNNFLGAYAGYCNTVGYRNNFFGNSAGHNNTTGSCNNFFGSFAGYYNTTGCYNNFFGFCAGYYNTSGRNNNFFGNYTGISTSASNKIIIGSGKQYNQLFDSPDTTKDIQFSVGIRTDANPSKYWLVGNENFNVGIGTTNPQYKLHIGGDINFTGTLYQNGSVFSGSGGTITSYWVSNVVGINTLSNVGIGTTNPTSKLTVSGDVLISGVTTSSDFNTTSDINFKTNVHQIENSLEKVIQIRGVTFDWKESKKSSAGVIAQEVEKVLPELVNNENPKTVNYNGITATLIEAIKELKLENDILKEKIEEIYQKVFE